MEEKKQYSVVGKVEIGTDEYRDLIESRMEVEKSKDYYMREGWKKDEEIKSLNAENLKLKEELDKLKKFVKKNQALINEDGITVFMSMFGEE